jgi:hypothetical protein
MNDERKAMCFQFITHHSSLIISMRPVSSDRLERQSYKLDVEGSIPSPAIPSGPVAQTERASVF